MFGERRSLYACRLHNICYMHTYDIMICGTANAVIPKLERVTDPASRGRSVITLQRYNGCFITRLNDSAAGLERRNVFTTFLFLLSVF